MYTLKFPPFEKNKFIYIYDSMLDSPYNRLRAIPFLYMFFGFKTYTSPPELKDSIISLRILFPGLKCNNYLNVPKAHSDVVVVSSDKYEKKYGRTLSIVEALINRGKRVILLTNSRKLNRTRTSEPIEYHSEICSDKIRFDNIRLQVQRAIVEAGFEGTVSITNPLLLLAQVTQYVRTNLFCESYDLLFDVEYKNPVSAKLLEVFKKDKYRLKLVFSREEYTRLFAKMEHVTCYEELIDRKIYKEKDYYTRLVNLFRSIPSLNTYIRDLALK